jgi:DNA-binding IclR family transcriptional regulator
MDGAAHGSHERSSPSGVVGRALAVLAAFEGTPGSLAVASIAKRAGLPISTTYRMVAELEEWGALRKGSDGRYQIGFRIWELGQQAGRRLRDRAHPYLQDLFDLTQENVHLAIRDGLQSLYVDKVYNSSKLPVVSRVGGRLPMHATAVGRVLLAAQPDWFITAYLERELEAPTPRTVTDAAELAAVLRTVQHDGYSITVEQMRLGALSVAVPVVYGDETVASVGLVFEAHRSADAYRVLTMLKGTAEKISAAMHGSMPRPRAQRPPNAPRGPILST